MTNGLFTSGIQRGNRNKTGSRTKWIRGKVVFWSNVFNAVRDLKTES